MNLYMDVAHSEEDNMGRFVHESFRPVSILDKGLDLNEDDFNYDNNHNKFENNNRNSYEEGNDADHFIGNRVTNRQTI
jgi:hypothetical protein